MGPNGMQTLTLPATMASFEQLMEFVRLAAVDAGCDQAMVGKLALAFEEAVVNVVNYAYGGGEGTVEVSAGRTGEGGMVIEIIDSGVAFNPLERALPDVAAPVEERSIGGLGILMIRQIMDSVTYKRERGRNILRMEKKSQFGGN
jgi:serine/threonine-protein kinase RsbW